ncbi:unnamed protein product, partial [marine sediment metagenome]
MVDILEGGAEAGAFIQNDNRRHVFAWSPHNHPPRYKYLKTTSGNITPGMIVKRGTGAGGEGTCTENGTQEHMGYGITELDKKQITLCTDTYASGDLIPVIPFIGNEGTICRNLLITDPSAAIPADAPFESDAGGKGEVSGEDIDTVYYRSEHHIADA